MTEHLERYELHPHIITAEQLGHFILERKKQRIPVGMEAYFDYERYGAIYSENSDIMTEAGLVVKKEDRAEEEKLGHEMCIRDSRYTRKTDYSGRSAAEPKREEAADGGILPGQYRPRRTVIKL